VQWFRLHTLGDMGSPKAFHMQKRRPLLAFRSQADGSSPLPLTLGFISPLFPELRTPAWASFPLPLNIAEAILPHKKCGAQL
jgi:hypothetical protein